jgi:ABC-type bacteriocin/lantibiotic exporter with double-glycine peptidase domain
MVAAPLTQAWERLSLKDIGFAHTPVQEEASRQSRGGLHQVSLTLHRGERIALVGPSGSGKSTLMRVLAGLYEPQHGNFEADGAPMSATVVGAMSTLIPQEADVFEATVLENIAFDMPCERSDIDRAIRVSAFDEVLVTMKDGLDTAIVERGFNMSGGQRQRLCLARGVLAARDSSIVLLDEPTSALDPVTEASVFENLGRHFVDATIVASVHRMSLLKHFDRVVLMVGGHLVDAGTVDELQSRQPMFANMLKGQSAKEESAV